MHINKNQNLNQFRNNFKQTVNFLAKPVALSSTLALAVVGGGVNPAMAVGTQTCEVTGEFDEFFVPNLLSSFSIPGGPSQPITKDYQFKYDIAGTEDCESSFRTLTQFNILGVEFSGGSTLVSKVPDVGFTLNGRELQATITGIKLLSSWNIDNIDYDTLDIVLDLDINSGDSSLNEVSFDLDFSHSMTNDLVSLNIFDNNPNTPIFVTSTPEPSLLLGLVGLGALALSNSMKKKNVM